MLKFTSLVYGKILVQHSPVHRERVAEHPIADAAQSVDFGGVELRLCTACVFEPPRALCLEHPCRCNTVIVPRCLIEYLRRIGSLDASPLACRTLRLACLARAAGASRARTPESP